MRRLVFFVALLLVLTACAADPPVRRRSPVDRFLDSAWPAGAHGTVAVARGDDLVTCRGFGTSDHDAELASGCDTVYDIGSITKSFTGTAIVKLEAMGKLRITDPIAAYLGAVPPDKRDLTVHHLLTHTAGLPDSLGDDYDPLTRADMISAALRAPVEPGHRYSYSNLGYSLLAAIIELTSGMTYEEFLAAYLFEPSGMTSTGYTIPAWDPTQVAVEYDERGKPQGKPYEHPWAPDGPHWNLRGNGGLLSTPRDLYRWHVALADDTILDETAKARLFEPRVRVTVEGYEDLHTGYGWITLSTEDDHLVAHTGGNGWSHAVYARLLHSGTMVFWVTNHAVQTGRWNLPDLELDLTLDLAKASAGHEPPDG